MSDRGYRRTEQTATLQAMPRPATVRPARRSELPDAARLLATSLGFAAEDALPAWFMRTTDELGGLTLVGVADDAVVGVAYVIPARLHGDPMLFLPGLAVAPAVRRQGIALELMQELRRWALKRGDTRICWTADPVNAPALRLYLSRLGALITGYRPALHDGLRADPGHPLDDVDIEWRLNDRSTLDDRNLRRVEISPDDRRRVRREMSALLADGYVGCAVDLERDAQCGTVHFARAA
jgi:predicted GNAT superfamily acetyltransferase